MAVLTRDQLWAQLKKGEIAPVYVLFGAEPYLRNKAAKFITDKALEGCQLREFNDATISLTGEDALGRILASANQLPMMASRRVIRIEDVRVSATGTRDSLKEDSETALAAYLADPADTTVLIFIADELDKRRRMSKLLLDKAVAVDFPRMEDADLANWARREITSRGFDIEERALHYFVGLVGEDMQRLETEIGKITTAALPDKLVTFELVDALVPSTRIISNFDLTDQLFSRDRTKTFTTLKKLLDDGAEPLMLLGLIASNYHRLFRAKEMMANGVERREVARILGLQYRKQEEFLALARRSDERRLAFALKRIAETDLAIKTSRGGGGPLGGRMQIELLVAEIAGG